MKENHSGIVYQGGPNGAINFVPSVPETFEENGFLSLLSLSLSLSLFLSIFVSISLSLSL